MCRNSACGPKRMPKKKILGQVQGLKMDESMNMTFPLFSCISFQSISHLFPIYTLAFAEVMTQVKLKTGRC